MQWGLQDCHSQSLSLHQRPIGVGLFVLHYQRGICQTAGGFEVQRFSVVVAAVNDGRIGERSPNGGKVGFADRVVYDLMAVEKVKTVGNGLAFDDDPKNERAVGDTRFVC